MRKGGWIIAWLAGSFLLYLTGGSLMAWGSVAAGAIVVLSSFVVFGIGLGYLLAEYRLATPAGHSRLIKIEKRKVN